MCLDFERSLCLNRVRCMCSFPSTLVVGNIGERTTWGGELVLLIRGAARPTIYPLALTEVGVNGKAGVNKKTQISSESNVDVVVERYTLKLCTRV